MQFSFLFTNDLFKSRVSTFKYEAAGLFPDGCFKDFFRPPKVILGRPNYVDAPKPFDDPGWNPIPAVRD